jgi:hypothetical protein
MISSRMTSRTGGTLQDLMTGEEGRADRYD